MNKQAIAGVVAIDGVEVTVMTVWPSVARYRLGQFLGELYATRLGFYIFTLGNLAAAATIPIALALYCLRVIQGLSYELTNRRIIERRFDAVRSSIGLDAFDSIEVEQNAGQIWYQAGDLVFRKDSVEVLRLGGVRHPESFRQTCLKSRLSHVAVKQAVSSSHRGSGEERSCR